MDEFILTKTSSNEELKRYFIAVLEISKSGKEFPINLDEVWPLVYGKKSDAVEALCKNFMQDVDYQVLRQNPQNLNGGRPSNIYMLTVSCMEFFIARKVRAVFEVYRQVFHGMANGMIALPDFNDPVASARAWADEKEKSLRLEAVNQAQQQRIEGMAPKADFADHLFRLDDKIRIGTCAKVLGLPFGPKTLFKKLRERGILFKGSTECNQRYINAGYFVMEMRHIVNGGKEFMVNVTYATQKGLAYIGYLFGKKPNVEQAQRLFVQAQLIDARENENVKSLNH